MAAEASQHSDLKQMMKAAWTAGDFGKIAEYNVAEGEAFVARLNLTAGMRVLDVGCGTGNQSLPAARTGARVTGVDIAPHLLAQARERAGKENLGIEFIEGDAEELPFGDGEFDVVFSMFGAMFAPRPDKVVTELVRVCRRQGLIAMANWTPSGFFGQQSAILNRHVPPPPGLPPNVLWGDEAVVRERFGPHCQVETSRQTLTFNFPFGPAEVVDHSRQYIGPMKMSFARLDAAGQTALANELAANWARYNEGDDHRTIVKSQYLQVHARPN
jgi:ubiquinone/menaquinone biosynthesis C-methylase UbiE